MINKVPEIKPFIKMYEKCPAKTSDWSTCVLVLSKDEKKKAFLEKCKMDNCILINR